jgi:S1-C subfamily serine protease
MAIEIRVLSGALAGQVRRFEQPVIVVGRQAGLDLRFDPQQDLDVSGRHAEIRAEGAGYVLHDTNSTNGTFVNGERVTGVVTLREGDKLRFGAKGPEAELRLSVDPDETLRPTPRKNTEQRIALAVSKHTAGMKRALVAAGVLVVAGGVGAWFYAKQQSARRVEELRNIVTSGQATGSDVQNRMGEVFRQNAGAVAIIIAEIDGKSFSGSGFSISKDGMIVTNRHNVLMDGKSATRLAVKFTDTREWLPAEVVKVSNDPDADIALIKMTRANTYPMVTGISATATGATEGMTVAAIGYPLGNETPMEGAGDDFLAKSTLNLGTVSKKTSAVLQIDSYATHGSSGSPVFNALGNVVGLIYGGARDAGGNIVYAVPPEKIAAFIPAEYRSIVRN